MSAGRARPPDAGRGCTRRSSLRNHWRLRRQLSVSGSRAHEYTVKLHKHAQAQPASLKKHERAPVWHAGPAAFTRSSTESRSQSRRTSSTSIVLPEVAPFSHRPRSRDRNHARPVSRVLSHASWSMYASIRTSPFSASCTTAGTSPFVKSGLTASPPTPSLLALAGVDREHDALGAEDLGAPWYQGWILQRGGVDGDLVRAVGQQLAHILHAANAAPYGEWDEHLLRRPGDGVEEDPARVRGRGDVEKNDLISALAVVGGGELGRVARIAQVLEAHAFHDPAFGHVQARYDPLGRHQAHRERKLAYS